MYSAAAICRSTHLPIPQEGRIITSDDVFGHLPDIRCINGGIDAAPAPPLDGAGQCAGLPGVLSEAGGRLPLHPKTRRSRAARYFGLPDKEISSGAVVMRWPAIYNKGSKIREEAHPVAKHLDKFTQPFRDSPIPFALAEILTNGSGEMVDLVCRFLNPAAAALLGLSPEEVQGRRLSQLGPERALEQLAPMQAVAFSGSSASFPYVTAGGQTLTVTCYQVMYGTVACLLDPRSGAGAQSGALPELLPGADLELNREGLRCLACSRQLCQLTQWSRRALLDRGGRAFSALVAPADWPALLQELLDAAREKRGVDHDFRLLRRDGGAVWVNLRAEILSTRQGATVFRGVFLDIDRLRREGQDLQAALSRRETALRDAETLLDRMPVGLCLLRRRPDGGVELLRANQVLSRLLGLSPAALARRLAEDPGSGLPTGEREELLAAAVRSRECGLPLRRACRVCLGGGRELCLSLHMSWVEQPDGSWLAYIACADISQEAAAQAEHQIRSRMYDLLLEHTSLLTLDYDPARDLAQIQRHSTSGRRTSRTVSGYLKSLLTASYLHPEDRRRLAGAVRRAITHPGTVSCTYRADYEDTGLAQLFGMPFVVLRKPVPFDTTTLNFNWQVWDTKAFSLYSRSTEKIDKKGADMAIAAVCRFLSRMNVLNYNVYGGYESTVLIEEELVSLRSTASGLYIPHVKSFDSVERGQVLADIIDPLTGVTVAQTEAPEDGIVFFAKDSPLVMENETLFKIVNKLHK